MGMYAYVWLACVVSVLFARERFPASPLKPPRRPPGIARTAELEEDDRYLIVRSKQRGPNPEDKFLSK